MAADKSPEAFRTISEVAQDLALPQHVLRFWETRFTQIQPLKRGGGRRYYRPDDVELLKAIRQLLYAEGYTIKGVQKLLRERGARAVSSAAEGGGLARSRNPTATTAIDALAAAAADDAGQDAPDRTDDEGLQALLACEPDIGRGVGLPGDRMLAPLDLRGLRSALADLAECSRLLAAAREV